MAGNWQKDRIYNHGEGIFRITDKSDPDFPNGAVWDAINMVYDNESDNPETMRGTTRLGTTDLGGQVSGLFDYDDGTKLIASCTDGKIYEYNGSDWAAESGARASGNNTTATTRWGGAMFYGATTAANLLILCNGVDAPAKYNGTDVTALGGSPPSTGNFPTEFMGRLWLASGDTLTASAPNNCEAWAIADGAKQMVVGRGQDGPILGLRTHGEVLLVFKSNSVWRIRPTLTFTTADITRVSNNIGLVGGRCISEAGSEGAENMVFCSSQGLEQVSATNTSVGVAKKNITRWPKQVISLRNKDKMDQAWLDFNIDRRELYFVYPNGTNTIPKEGIIGNFSRSRKAPRWTRFNRKNLTAGIVYKDTGTEFVQYTGDSNGRVYKMHVTTAKDWAGSPFTSTVVTPFHTQAAPEFMKEYGWSYVDVQTEGDYVVTVNQVLMRRGIPITPSNVNKIGVLGAESGWGEGYWGVAIWGGITYAGQRFRPPGSRRGAGLGHVISSSLWFRLNAEVVAYKFKRDSIAA